LATDANDPNAERCIAFHRYCLLLVAGRTDALAAQQPETLRTLDTLPDRASLQAWVVALGAARSGDAEGARRTLRGLGPAHHLGARSVHAMLADCAVRCGAEELFETLSQRFGLYRDCTATLGPFAFVCFLPIAAVVAKLGVAMGRVPGALGDYELASALARRMRAAAHEAWVELDWGADLARLGADDARGHLESALGHGERLGMPEVVTRARALLDAPAARDGASRRPVPSSTPASPAFTLARAGAEWTVSHGGRSFRVRDVRGMTMVARLVERPGVELHAVDVAADAASPETPAVVDLGDAGEVLDRKARSAYKRRLADLRDELEEANGFHDEGRVAKLEHEIEMLTAQIAGAVGLGGRERRAGTAAERARITVQRRVREAIRKIAEHDADLGRHLDWAIRTGTYCAYEPGGRKSGR